MKISEICLKRPVFASVLSLVILVLGILGYSQLELRFQPKVFKPHLSVVTRYPGASAEEIEQSITDKLEKQLAGTPNLEQMSSDSQEGVSSISLKFKAIDEQTFLIAQSQVLQEIATVDLPEQAEQPSLYSHNQNKTLIGIAFTDPNMSFVQLADYVQNIVINRLQKVPGTSDIQQSAFSPALRIELNPLKMAEYQLTLDDLIQVLKNSNISFSVGQITSHDQVLTLNGNFLLKNVKDFQNLMVARIGGHTIRLHDIADVQVGFENNSGWYSLHNGKPAVMVFLSNTDESNPIEVGQTVEKTLAQMQKSFPPGMHYYTVYDLTQPLKQSITEVAITIAEAIALVVLVSFLFLGRLRTTLIPTVTIPICLMGAFLVMYGFNFSINTLTLLALVLAVGLVVDDAIVVMENHHRHMENGLSAMQAAFKSVKEISFAVIGMTLALVAVYVPAGFLAQNTTGVFYKQFAYTLAAAVLISGFVALTLSPMMCGKLLTRNQPSRYEKFLEKFFSRLKTGYQRSLEVVLNVRAMVIVAFFVLLGFGLLVFKLLPSDFLPPNNVNIAMMFLHGPATASAEYTRAHTDQTLKAIEKLPGIKSSTTFAGGTFTGSNVQVSFFALQPDKARKFSDADLLAKINKIISQNKNYGGGAHLLDLNNNSGGYSGSNSFYILGMASYDQLRSAANQMIKALQQYPGINSLYNTLTQVQQQYNFEVNRQLAQALNVPIANIVLALEVYYGGYSLTPGYNYGGMDYPIIIKLPQKDLEDLTLLKSIYVPSLNGQQIALSRLVTVKPILGVADRAHLNQLRAGEIDFNITPEFTEGQAINEILKVAAEVLPSSMTIGFDDSSLKMQKETRSMSLIFILGIIFIYLVLAALFESFREPLIILLTVPLCVVGALVALKAIDGSLNMYTAIGLVTLIGLVSKHGILITRFANQLRAQGMEMKTALVTAAAIRLRPILMTTLTMILGAVPLLFASGSGASGREQIGWVIVAGLIVGTLFSLFVVPVAYTILAPKKLNKQD